MRASMAFLLALALPTAAVAAQGRTTLDIYVVDVEGGNGTLFVTPAGESVLIDTGNANGAVRDVGRIMDAVKDAGLTQIDHLILTHYHGDHFGGMEAVVEADPDQGIYRPRAECAAGRRRGLGEGCLSQALCQCEAYGGQARRQDCPQGRRLAHRRLRPARL